MISATPAGPALHLPLPIFFQAVDRPGMRVPLVKILDLYRRSAKGQMFFFKLTH
jgi:hypothetical protein